MTTLLELKEKLIRFYGKNEIYVKPAIRFILALFTFLVINNSIGYMKLVSKTPVAVILALVCSMLPVNGLIAIAALVVLADLYALSIELLFWLRSGSLRWSLHMSTYIHLLEYCISGILCNFFRNICRSHFRIL